MKKCPFCKADIEENARFCLYCMTSLEEKEVIKTTRSNNKRWLILIAAVLVFVLAIIWLLFAFKNDPPTDIGDTASPTTTVATNGTTDASTTTTNKSGAVSDSTTSTTNQTPQKGQPQTNAEKTTQSKQDTSTTLNPPTVSTDKTTQTGSGSSSSTSTTKPSSSTVTYTYRDATYGDDFSVDANLENSVVITGVSNISLNGEYSIPETINGKTVVAIMGSAFCDDHIKNTVKIVIIPKTVKTIWNYAFADCYNLTDIYFCGKSIYTEAKAFAESSKRTETLTIHCSADCSDRNFRYYKNSAANYDAHYKEWNG